MSEWLELASPVPARSPVNCYSLVRGKKNCIPWSQHSVRFTNIREHCVSRPWALRNCQNPWDSRGIRETWQVCYAHTCVHQNLNLIDALRLSVMSLLITNQNCIPVMSIPFFVACAMRSQSGRIVPVYISAVWFISVHLISGLNVKWNVNYIGCPWTVPPFQMLPTEPRMPGPTRQLNGLIPVCVFVSFSAEPGYTLLALGSVPRGMIGRRR